LKRRKRKDRNWIINHYRDGWTLREISKASGYHWTSIRKILERSGVKLRTRSEAAAAAIERKQRREEIAKRLRMIYGLKSKDIRLFLSDF